MDTIAIPLKQKIVLTPEEAEVYTGIDINRLWQMSVVIGILKRESTRCISCTGPLSLTSGCGRLLSREEQVKMRISYKKLWKLLIDKEMKKKELCAKAGVNPATITKMGKNGYVTTEVLSKICLALDCKIGDITEIIL